MTTKWTPERIATLRAGIEEGGRFSAATLSDLVDVAEIAMARARVVDSHVLHVHQMYTGTEAERCRAIVHRIASGETVTEEEARKALYGDDFREKIDAALVDSLTKPQARLLEKLRVHGGPITVTGAQIAPAHMLERLDLATLTSAPDPRFHPSSGRKLWTLKPK